MRLITADILPGEPNSSGEAWEMVVESFEIFFESISKGRIN